MGSNLRRFDTFYNGTIDTSCDAQIDSLTDTLSQDNSDAQYRSFRVNLPALTVLMAAFVALKYAYMRPVLRGSTPADNLHRIPFYILFSLLMLTILHGASILKVLFILAVNYVLSKVTAGTRLAIPATWLFNGGVLFANKWYEGYAFANLHPAFEFLVSRCHLFPYSLITVLTILIGCVAWHLPSLACQLQHHHATPGLIQH